MATVPRKVQAQTCLDALTTLVDLETRQATPTPLERQRLSAFPGFGCLALDLFPNPVTGQYADAGWEGLGTRLQQILTPEDYASAARSTYTAFYTPRLIMRALFLGLARLGVPDDATVLEPGIGSGRFCAVAPSPMQFVGVEQDHVSARICRLLYPQHDIRLGAIQRTMLDPESVDAVVGNVPFSQETTAYWGRKLSLHELCLAKSIDALRPGGILALVVTHSLLDRERDTFRRLLAQRATLLGAFRLPSAAFATEGTRVVADLLFLQKTVMPTSGPSPAWTRSTRVELEGVDVALSTYFQDNPAHLLGRLTRQDRLYGAREGYSVTSTGDLAQQLASALTRLPKQVYAVQPAAPRAHQASALPTGPLAEGAVLVHGDQICQRRGGQLVPVCQRTGVLGTRVAHLLQLRDQTREVLHLQHAGAPTPERQAARARLQATYLAFVRTYGPINTVSLSVRTDGTTQRRLPNLATFREDPDAMLVMALEEYDEQTGTATPAAILTQDVVTRAEPITQVESAAEGLLVVLATTGRVDVAAIADLYGQSEDAVVQELGPLLYYDPDSQQWETADVYLSGNVKHKLAAARQACAQDSAYQRNVDALVAVQPPDLLPGDIEANLGAAWLSPWDVQTFAREVFGSGFGAIRVVHNAAEALWQVDAPAGTLNSEKARVDFGTARISGVKLLEQALNLHTPTIYDPDASDPHKRVVNEAETLVAREKQRALKAAFRAWAFAEPQRAERLVRHYNDLHNTHRLRSYNGAHLTWPGLSPLLPLRSAQSDAVWRIMTGGNTLLGLDVGSGKSAVMIAAGMQMRHIGLIRKPLYVVPNHLLEEFGREWLRFYPGARLLLAGSEDFGKARRKLMAAQMVSQGWDGIITTHSAFTHLAMSPAFQAQALQTLIAAYGALIVDHVREHSSDFGNIRKALERQQAAYEDRLRTLLASAHPDDGLYFDELGIDYLFLDEAQAWKNLETPTKMQRVAGIHPEGSARAFDLLLKTQYLRQQYPGRGTVTFATATPISNSMGELYTIQRYLTPDALEAHGLGHFDAWAATFGEVIDVMEIAPDGKTLRERSRFARFVNLPELQQMVRGFAEVKTKEQLQLPIPQLAGGAPEVVACPLSPTQQTMMDQLVARYERVKRGQAGYRSGEAVKITTDGRKLALDARLLANVEPWPYAKSPALVERVLAHYHAGAAYKATQLIFADMGVSDTPWGFNFYNAVIAALVAAGIPRHEIARMDEADTDLKKHRLFTQVRSGQVRVLLGSTGRMGTGTNVQTRLLVLHHLDAPWTPEKIAQREGRILRQHNLHHDMGVPVHIYRFVTEGSFDAFMWQALQTKAHFIHQFLTGATSARSADDVGVEELSYAQVKAIASGNPAFLTLAETEAELRRCTLVAKHHRDQVFVAQRRLKELPDERAVQQRLLAQLHADERALARWDRLPLAGQRGEACTGAPFGGVLTLDGQLRPSADVRLREAEARSLLDPILEPYLGAKLTQTVRLGTYKGLAWGVSTSTWTGVEVWLAGQVTRRTMLGRRTRPGGAALSCLRELEKDTPVRVAQAQHHVARLEQDARTAQAQIASAAPGADYAIALEGLKEQLEASLSAGGDASQQPALMQAITALREAHRQHPQTTGDRSESPVADVAEAVTTTILRAQEAEARAAAAQEPAAAD